MLLALRAIIIVIDIIFLLALEVVADPKFKFTLSDDNFFLRRVKNLIFVKTIAKTTRAALGFSAKLCFVYCSTVPTFPVFLLVID